MTSGEEFAEIFSNKPEKYSATEEQIEHYRKHRKIAVAHKRRNGGVIGVRKSYSGGIETFSARIPPHGQVLYFRNGLQAAMFYNQWTKHLFGEDAVLCDMDAVIARFVYKRDKTMRYKVTHHMVKSFGMSWIEDINATSVAEIINDAIRQGIVGPPTWHVENNEKQVIQVFVDQCVAEKVASKLESKCVAWEG